MAIPTALRAEFATLQKSWLSFMGFFGGQGMILGNPDRTLQAKGGGQGLLLYERVLEDPHVHAVFQQRKLELVSRDWRVEPASDAAADVKAAELVDRQLESLGARDYALANVYGGQGFDGVTLHLLDAIAKGYSVAEIMWGQDGKEIVVAEIRPKDQRRFGFVLGEQGWELRLITDLAGAGEPLPDRKFIYHSPTATDANPYGLGLCSTVFWPVFFKKQNIQFWLIFADKFGSPTPVGKYPPGTSEADKDTLLKALANITQGMATTVPEGMVLELLEATRSGSVDTYERLCKYCDQQISEAVLGQTGTTNQSDSGGSRARDEVAREGMLSVVTADADLLSRTLDRTLIRWIVELNRPILGEQAHPPQFRWVFDQPEDLNQMALRDKILFDMGYPPNADYIVSTYGEGFAPPDEADKEAAPAPLNGAQVQSLVALLTTASEQGWSPALLDATLMATFPQLPEATRQAIAQGVQDIERAEESRVHSRSNAPAQGTEPPSPPSPLSQGGEGELPSPPAPLPEGEGGEETAAFAEGDGDPVTVMVRRLAAAADPEIAAMVAVVQAELGKAESLEEFNDRLITLYPELDSDPLSGQLATAMAAARLAGRAAVVDEIAEEAE